MAAPEPAPRTARSDRWLDAVALLALALAVALPLRAVLAGDRCILSFDTRLDAFAPFRAAAPPGVDARPKNLVTSDLNGWIVPEMDLVVRELRAGRMPLWNPYPLCGQPLLANLAYPAFYPPNLLALAIEPLRALAWQVAFHLWLAGAFAYLLLRRLGIGRIAALAAGLAAAFAPWLAVRIHLPTTLATGAWFFGLLLAVERLIARPDRHALAGLGLATGMTLLAGFPQLAALELLGAAVWFLLRLRASPAKRSALALGAGAAALGLALGAAHLLPSASLLRDSLRGAWIDPALQASHGLRPAALAGIAWPELLGDREMRGIPDWLSARLGTDKQENPVENQTSPGIAALLFALLALGAVRREPAVRALLVLALLGLLLAVDTPALRWIHAHVPLLAAGNPKRALVLFALALPLLAGFGIAAAERRWKIAPWLAAAGIAIQLVPFALRFNPFQETAGQYPRTPAIERLASSADRSVRFANHAAAAAELSPRFGYRCLDGGEPMVLRRFGELIESIEPGRFDRADPRLMDALADARSLDHPAFLRTATPRIVATAPIAGATLPVEYASEVEGLGIYRQDRALPRARRVAGCEVVADPDARLRRLADPALDGAACAVLESDPGLTIVHGSRATSASLAIADERPGRIHLRAGDCAEATLAVVAECFHSGWRATLDGDRVPVLPADHAFMAVALPPGAHDLVLEYAPWEAYVGLGLSAAALVALLAIALTRSRADAAGS